MGNKIKGIDTFTCFADERNTEKILALRSMYGNEAYAIYYMLRQLLATNELYRLPLDMQGIAVLSMDMRVEKTKLQELLDFMAEIGLVRVFTEDRTYLTCDDLVEEMKVIEAQKEKARLKVQKFRSKLPVEKMPVKQPEKQTKKPAQKEVQQPLLEINQKEHKLQKFIRDTKLEDGKTDKFAKIKRVDRQLTFTEAETLVSNYPDPKYMLHVLEDMENRKDLVKRYSHLYKALCNWCKRGWADWQKDKGVKAPLEKEERLYSKEIR